MEGFNIASLGLLLETIGEEKTQSILADYSCPINADIEDFLLHKAVAFDRQSIAKTHVVFADYKERPVMVGYFTIASKVLFIRRTPALSAKMRSRINRFARPLNDVNGYEISAPLIAQLGKNFTNGYDRLITGDELLALACDSVRKIQALMGGKIAYLECEDTPKLLAFYERNGFVAFDRRALSPSDRQTFKSDHLVQMLRYF